MAGIPYKPKLVWNRTVICRDCGKRRAAAGTRSCYDCGAKVRHAFKHRRELQEGLDKLFS